MFFGWQIILEQQIKSSILSKFLLSHNFMTKNTLFVYFKIFISQYQVSGVPISKT